MTEGRTHEHHRNATDGVWMLKLAIAVGSAALFATVMDQIAAAIVLYVAAFTAAGVFYRKYMRPAYRKYVQPFKHLPAQMERLEGKVDTLQDDVAALTVDTQAVKADTQAVKADTAGIKISSEAARELATSAVDVAHAVGRQLGIRGDGE